MKNKLKTIAARNGWINNKFYNLLSHNPEPFLSILGSFKAVDCIQNPKPIKDFRRAVDENNQVWFTTNANISNSLIYGIWNGLFGGFNDIPLYKTPAVEHGLIFSDQIFTDIKFTARPAIITFGDYRFKVIRQYFDRPIFRVGPYIHYVEPFYDEIIHAKIKKNWGKTLLVFPSHGTDDSSISFGQKEYLNKVKTLAKKYDTVVVNSFWWNINDPIIEAFEAEGFRIATAGIRDDIMFLPRLKSLINLSDTVVGDDIGTHVGYISHLGKPYQLLTVSSEEINYGPESHIPIKTTEDLNRMRQAYMNSKVLEPKELKICEYYWGYSHIKTPEEIKAILEIAQDIEHTSMSSLRKNRKAVSHLLSQYQKTDIKKYNLLYEAAKK